MNIYPHWDWTSMILYIIMGAIGSFLFSVINKCNQSQKSSLKHKKYYYYLIWLVTWVIFATFRYVASGIGGIDASAYVMYYDVCLNPNGYWYADHLSFLYKIINQCFRIVFDDYHIFFAFIYGFIVLSYIYFVEEFRFSKMSSIPIILVVYIFIRGFCTIRTNISVACVLFSIVYLHKNNTIKSVIFAVTAVLMHVASILYAGFVVFYYLYNNKRFGFKKCIAWIIIAAAVGRLGQYLIANYNFSFLANGSYKWYAVYSMDNVSFMESYFKISFSQIVLGITMFVMKKPIINDLSSRNTEEKNKISFIILLCFYDFIMIPITYILNIWRGYEYLYIARLMMWGELIYLFIKRVSRNNQAFVKFCFVLLFISWMIFRQYNTWEDSGLMPYVFEPFLRLFN